MRHSHDRCHSAPHPNGSRRGGLLTEASAEDRPTEEQLTVTNFPCRRKGSKDPRQAAVRVRDAGGAMGGTAPARQSESDLDDGGLRSALCRNLDKATLPAIGCSSLTLENGQKSVFWFQAFNTAPPPRA